MEVPLEYGYLRHAIMRDEERRHRFINEHCRLATKSDYGQWLSGYIQSGGAIDYFRDYPMQHGWFVLTSVGELPELYGAQSIDLIVPIGIHVFGCRTFHGRSGHNNIYYMDNYRFVGGGVAVFRNIEYRNIE